MANKKTYLLIKALELSSEGKLENLRGWLNKKEFNPEEKINAVKTIYTDLGINKLSENKIDQYYQNSSEILDQLNLSNAQKAPLKTLSEKMLKRLY